MTDWNTGLIAACGSGGHLNIKINESMLGDPVSTLSMTNWNSGLSFACGSGHLNI